jgi:hypothetical protein
MTTLDICKIFKDSIDYNKDYNLKQLNTLLIKAYTIAVSSTENDEDIHRISASLYNKFMREKFRNLQNKYPDSSPQELMKQAATEWNQSKASK